MKGGAGIMEFAAMERAVHAAENVLSDARSGQQPLTGARVGDCLSCLDQVVQWLDLIEATGELPKNADAAADRVVRRFEAAPALAAAGSDQTSVAAPPWLADLLSRHPSLTATASSALRFIPDADCFFQGEDPLARITSSPGLLAMDVEPASPPPTLQTFDPYRCNLIFTILTAAAIPELNAHMKGCSGEFEVVAIRMSQSRRQDRTLSARARDVLAAQFALLRDVQPQNFIGRVASAGLTAANVLRFGGQSDRAETMARYTQQSLADNAVQPLRDAIAQMLADDAADSSAAEPSRPTETAQRTLRIDAERIDALVRLTSELTVAKNAVGHLVNLRERKATALPVLCRIAQRA